MDCKLRVRVHYKVGKHGGRVLWKLRRRIVKRYVVRGTWYVG